MRRRIYTIIISLIYHTYNLVEKWNLLNFDGTCNKKSIPYIGQIAIRRFQVGLDLQSKQLQQLLTTVFEKFQEV